MIRINLLEVRPRSAERLDTILSTGRSSTFISRREALLGVLFLALTAGILAVFATRFGSSVPEPDAVAAVQPELPLPEPVDPPPSPLLAAEPPSAEPLAAQQSAAEPPFAEAPPPEIQPEPEPAVPPSPPAQPAVAAPKLRLTDVRATVLEDRVDVFLEIPGSPDVSRFRLDNPARLVFDFTGSEVAAPASRLIQPLDGALIQRVRIGQYKTDPPVVRVVLEVGERPVKAEVASSEAGVGIQVTPEP